jgi:hypothetical protein
MAAFTYNPTQYKLPELPKLQTRATAPSTQTINNDYAKQILDTFGQKIKPITSYTQNNKLENLLAPTQELGNQFIQQALLPEFQRDTYDPFMRQMQNRTAGSNISLLGSNPRFQQQQTRQITQPFYNQAQAVQDQFNQLATQSANDFLKSYYDPQVNF